MNVNNHDVIQINEIIKDNFPYVNKLFGKDSEKAWEVIENNSFPEKKINVTVHNFALIQLLYLASMKPKIKESIFTEKELKVINKSEFWGAMTTWSLRVCFVVNEILCIGIGFSTLFPLNTSGGNTNTTSTSNKTGTSIILTPGEQGVLATSISIIAITTALSFWSTGFSPNFLSISSNSTQDLLSSVTDTFNNLAGRLLHLHFSKGKDEALLIANHMDIKQIKKIFFDHTQNKEKARQVIVRMRQTVNYIKTGELPENIELLNIIMINKKKSE